jgi:hypothetical protein
MALGSTQPLTEMSTRNLPVGKGRQAREAENLTAIRKQIVWKMWEPRRLTTLWASTACYRDSFTFFFLFRPFCGVSMDLPVITYPTQNDTPTFNTLFLTVVDC